MYQNTIPSTTHDGVLKVAAEAEALAQPTAVLISGDDRKADDEGFRAHGSTLAQGGGGKTHAFHRGQPNRSEERGLPHSSIRMNSEASCGCFCEEQEQPSTVGG